MAYLETAVAEAAEVVMGVINKDSDKQTTIVI